jgi:hypothetical protein
MTWPVSELPDRPFAGAHSQVPHASSGSADVSTRTAGEPAALPLDALCERSQGGWTVRLRVHAEHITITKEVVVTERVVLRRNQIDDVLHIGAVVQREQLQVEADGKAGTTYLADHLSDFDTDRLAARQACPGAETSTNARSHSACNR